MPKMPKLTYAHMGALIVTFLTYYSVFKRAVKGGDSMNKRWLYAAGIRCIRTFAQSLIAAIGTGAVALHEVNWSYALSVAAVAGILSLLTSLAGLPEVDLEESIENNEEE